MTTTPGSKASAISPETFAAPLPWISWACLLAAGGVVFFPLTYSWDYLSDYSFGWWVPLLALLLIAERWTTRPASEPDAVAPRVAQFIILWGMLFFGLRMALEGSLLWRFPLWGCTLLYVGAVLQWFRVYGGAAWLRHFAFPVCFLLLSVPWPSRIEVPLVQGLAPTMAWLVAHFMVLLGMSAQAEGTTLVFPNCVLGVEEACSGLRSLQAAMMIAFLLGELYRLSWIRRGQILLFALALALLGNFLRTLFLSLLAYFYGADVMTHWHDTAGGAILVATSLTTWLVCHFVIPRTPLLPPSAGEKVKRAGHLPKALPARWLACGILFMAVLGVAMTQGWYAWKERGTARYPTWTANLPTSGNARELNIPNQSRDLLKYDQGREVEWQDDQSWAWTAYWFRYHQKPWGEEVFRAHNPDKCLVDVGFVKVGNYDTIRTEVHGVPLQIYPKLFTWKDMPVYVFWVVYADRSNFPMERAVHPKTNTMAENFLEGFSSIKNGLRSSTAEMESLEIILTGPDNYPAAQVAYLAELPKIVIPDGSPPSFARTTTNP